MVNGVEQELPAVQHVKAGAVVHLNKPTLEHGVLFHHPDLPPFKMFLEIDEKDGKKVIGKYRFEIVEKASAMVQRMVVDIVHPEEPKEGLVMPPESKLIMPGG